MEDQSLTTLLKAVLDYAEGKNPEGRDFFQEMDADPEFQKSLQNLEAIQKQQKLSTHEVVQAELMSVMVENDMLALATSGSGGYTYYDSDMYIDSDLLRAAGKSESALLIKNHRKFQLDEFGRFSHAKEQPGFRLVHKNPDKILSKKEIEEINKWSEIIADRFFFLNGSDKASLGQVLQAAYDDFFDIGCLAFFVWRRRDGVPLGLIQVDSALVKKILPDGLYLDRWDSTEWNLAKEAAEIKADANDRYKDEFRYVLLDKNKTRMAKFTKKSMLVHDFFRTSSYRDLFKGTGIIGQAVKIITDIICSIELNASRISNNRVPQGVLAVQGGAATNQAALEKFKRLLWAQTMGAQNRWKIPIIALPDKNQLQWLSFHENNKDVMFFEWVTLRFTMFCRLSGTDPEELSMASNKGMVEGKGALFASSTEGIMRKSKDLGLRSFLGAFAEFINDSGIIAELTGNDQLIGKFSGLDVKDEQAKATLNKTLLETTHSVNELLKIDGKEEVKLEIGGINPYDLPGIQNQQMFQMVMMKIQQGVQQEMGGGEGEETNNQETEQEPDREQTAQNYGNLAELMNQKGIRKSYGAYKNIEVVF